LEESKEKYEEILAFIQHDEKYIKDGKLIDTVQGKIRIVEESLDEVDNYTKTPVLSEEVQTLISRLFSSSQDEDMAGLSVDYFHLHKMKTWPQSKELLLLPSLVNTKKR